MGAERPSQSKAVPPPELSVQEASERSDSWIGATLEDKYRIHRLLGSGGMGSVYLAHHIAIGRRVAVKMLHPEYGAHSTVLKRFENEAKAIGRFSHPNLVAVTDFGWAGAETPYIVMEYLEGSDCATLLERHGTLPFPRATDLVFQASLGLAIAHRAGIVHRDIKPENLFVAQNGDGSDQVKVLDFGIAKLRAATLTTATAAGATIGTYFYMSPEQVRDSARVDARTDVWSAGVVLYELLSGHRPFTGEEALEVAYSVVHTEPLPLERRRPELPRELVQVVERAMAKDAAQRFDTIEAMGRALMTFTGRNSGAHRTNASIDLSAASRADDGSVSALERTKPTPTTSHAGVAMSRRPGAVSSATRPRGAMLLAAGGAALLLTAGVGVYAYRDSGPSHRDTAGRQALDAGIARETVNERVSATSAPPRTSPVALDGGLAEMVDGTIAPPSPSTRAFPLPAPARVPPTRAARSAQPPGKRATAAASSAASAPSSKAPTADDLFGTLY